MQYPTTPHFISPMSRNFLEDTNFYNKTAIIPDKTWEWERENGSVGFKVSEYKSFYIGAHGNADKMLLG